ncbi:uncharacterized protein DMENIID0001_170700 [Sergentomyia squamirostris]
MKICEKEKRQFKHSTTFYRHLKKQIAAGNHECVKVLKNKKPQTTTQQKPLKASGINLSFLKQSLAESSVESENETEKLKKILRIWALKNNISHSHVSELLRGLNACGHPTLPIDARTLLGTSKSINIKEVSNGEYWHNGVGKTLQTALKNLSPEQVPKEIHLLFNADGLPLSKSSKVELWPLLYRIMNIPQMKSQVAGMFCGKTKPGTADDLLKPLVAELKCLITEGIEISGRKIPVVCKGFTCDSPARAFVKGICNFNAYHGCSKCDCIGTFFYEDGRHMSFINTTNANERTDETFRMRSDPKHHKTTSPLEELPLNMIKDFPVGDALHLIDLGVTKRLLKGWQNGTFTIGRKFTDYEAEKISDSLLEINKYKPSELTRAIRGLDCLHHWKGVECRVFTLYTGIVALKGVLPVDKYHHFLLLVCAVTICSCKKYLKYVTIAETLLKIFVERYKTLYGIDQISSNVHNLTHLAADVQQFGDLAECSTYPFENLLGVIKKFSRSGYKPLIQIAKRISERMELGDFIDNDKNYPIVKKRKPELGGFQELWVNKDFKISSDKKNKWFMTRNKEIVEFDHAVMKETGLLLFGSSIKRKRDFFETPFNSSRLNIFETTDLSQNTAKYYNIEDVECKLFCIPSQSSTFVFSPLLHTMQ